MKKLFLLVLVCGFFAVGTTSAQNENYYGGQKGSWAITVGADPVINFVGNLFNGNQDNKLNNLGASLSGKYFVGDKFALTAGVGFNNYKEKDFTYNPADDDHKEIISTDTEGYKNFSLNVGVQYNFRPGKRLQPFVGADLYFGREIKGFTIDENFEYKDGKVSYYDSKSKISTPVNTFGCVAKIGVEYFLGKSVSISGALDLGVYTSAYKRVQKYETDSPNATNDYINSKNYSIKNSRTTQFATGLMNGNIGFNFYF